MLRDITIGQYYAADSAIHRMDPRTKILWTIFYMTALFMCGGAAQYAVMILFTLWLVKKSRVPLGFVVRGLKPIVVIVILTALLNVFMTPGETVLFSKGIFTVTLEGVYMAVKMTVRIILLITASSLLTLTTTPTVLTGGLELLLNPLKKIGIPIQIFVMMMSIAPPLYPHLALRKRIKS